MAAKAQEWHDKLPTTFVGVGMAMAVSLPKFATAETVF